MSLIYHITTMPEWKKAQQGTFYESAALKEEGFIHCCEEGQVKAVCERYYKGKKDLVKLVIDTDKLNSQLIYEWSPSVAETFPHVYGPINVDSVIQVEKIGP